MEIPLNSLEGGFSARPSIHSGGCSRRYASNLFETRFSAGSPACLENAGSRRGLPRTASLWISSCAFIEKQALGEVLNCLRFARPAVAVSRLAATLATRPEGEIGMEFELELELELESNGLQASGFRHEP